jgi:hypothetical protein
LYKSIYTPVTDVLVVGQYAGVTFDEGITRYMVVKDCNEREIIVNHTGVLDYSFEEFKNKSLYFIFDSKEELYTWLSGGSAFMEQYNAFKKKEKTYEQ